jgi:predicted RNase H-like nuclease (RuvC/YqgF family)
LRAQELRNAEISLENKSMKSEVLRQEKENKNLEDQIKRLHDPVVVRFERDALVETYKKRITELEVIVKSYE